VLDRLGTAQRGPLYETTVMSNLGYFQLKANPGVWQLRLREGRSKEIFAIAKADGMESSSDVTVGELLLVVIFSRFLIRGRPLPSHATTNSQRCAADLPACRLSNLLTTQLVNSLATQLANAATCIRPSSNPNPPCTVPCLHIMLAHHTPLASTAQAPTVVLDSFRGKFLTMRVARNEGKEKAILLGDEPANADADSADGEVADGADSDGADGADGKGADGKGADGAAAKEGEGGLWSSIKSLVGDAIKPDEPAVLVPEVFGLALKNRTGVTINVFSLASGV
jgi:hypothetical protein